MSSNVLLLLLVVLTILFPFPTLPQPEVFSQQVIFAHGVLWCLQEVYYQCSNNPGFFRKMSISSHSAPSQITQFEHLCFKMLRELGCYQRSDFQVN